MALSDAKMIKCSTCSREFNSTSHKVCPRCAIDIDAINEQRESYERLRMQLPWYANIASKNYLRATWVTLVAYAMARILSSIVGSVMNKQDLGAGLIQDLNPMNGNRFMVILTIVLFIFTLFRFLRGDAKEILISVTKAVFVLTIVGNLLKEQSGLFNPGEFVLPTVVAVLIQFAALNILLSLDMYGASIEAAQRADRELGITTDASRTKRTFWFRYIVIATALYFTYVAFTYIFSGGTEVPKFDCNKLNSDEYWSWSLSQQEQYLKELYAQCRTNS